MLDIFRNEPEIRTFAPGEFLFQQGDDAAHHMFAILEGEVEIDRGERVVAKLGPNDLVGEMALIDAMPRSASAKALTPVRAAVVSEKRFLFLVQQHPSFSLAMLRVLTQRLRTNLES
jgi:CRP-like cAMP-binding protein